MCKSNSKHPISYTDNGKKLSLILFKYFLNKIKIQ